MWLLANEGKGQADAAAESVENLLEYHLECLHKQDTHTHMRTALHMPGGSLI